MAMALAKRNPVLKATPKLKPVSRAVLRRIEPGNLALCTHCEQPVKFQARKHLQQVICNVYENGRWKRVEHFHKECYAQAKKPYGKASTQGLTRTGKGFTQPVVG